MRPGGERETEKGRRRREGPATAADPVLRRDRGRDRRPRGHRQQEPLRLDDHPGDTLGVSEVTSALFAAVAANEAERAAPGVTLVDVSMIGAAGRIYLSGPPADVQCAQREITQVLSVVAGRDHLAGREP